MRSGASRFGVDTGGTFTDVVARDADGSLRVHKLLSTPHDPSAAIADGLRALEPDVGGSVVHGTTVATNALLERRGCSVAFVTTAGFEDLLRLGRQARPDLYALEVTSDEPLALHSVGVVERLSGAGDVLQPLDDEEIARVVAALKELAPEAVAICLLHSYANPEHEQRLAAAVRGALPTQHVSLSSELVGEFREYERASTTVVNGYVGPVMSRYIASLARRLPGVDVEVMQSSGGRASLSAVEEAPVHTVLSGPAGGVVGALAAARDAGFERIISFDMGGTSTDVSLCEGEPPLTYDAEIAGMPLRLPTLDILTVGAGGGSIAYVDAGGALRVGPRSAGAVPGPAAYGGGGEEPTVTDAHVALGSLRPDRFLGGEMQLDLELAREAVGRVASTLDLGIEETARGILDIADASMVRAIKVICSRRGRDPRDFALVSFGGAGGLHACRIAERLGVRTVLVPAHPGLLSAHGMLHAPRMKLFAESVMGPLDSEVVQRALEALAGRAARDFGPSRQLHYTIDLRYVGQSFEVELPLQRLDDLEREFEARHEELFGYADPGRAIEVVTVRLAAVESVEAEHLEPPDAVQPPVDFQRIDLGSGMARTAVTRREGVRSMTGPAVLTEYSGTTIVPAGWDVAEALGHLVLRRMA